MTLPLTRAARLRQFEEDAARSFVADSGSGGGLSDQAGPSRGRINFMAPADLVVTTTPVALVIHAMAGVFDAEHNVVHAVHNLTGQVGPLVAGTPNGDGTQLAVSYTPTFYGQHKWTAAYADPTSAAYGSLWPNTTASALTAATPTPVPNATTTVTFTVTGPIVPGDFVAEGGSTGTVTFGPTTVVDANHVRCDVTLDKETTVVKAVLVAKDGSPAHNAGAPISVNVPQKAYAGAPGYINGAEPANLAALNLAGLPAVPATAWTTGQFIYLTDASQNHWNGTTYVAGVAP